ncbi:MAG: GerAB/ArcD/ProY family transporter [Dehalobacterium sp.]
MVKLQAEIDKLNPQALTALMILSIVEYEIFTFSRMTIGLAKQDAWLAVIIGAVIGSICVFFFVKLAARFPQKSYFLYLRIVWGKPLGLLFAFSYLLFWIVFLSLLFNEAMVSNNLLFLPKTPAIVPLLILAITLIWLISYGLTPIIRFFQLLLPFLVIPLVLLSVLFLRSIDWSCFQPVLGNGLLPVLKGSLTFLGAYQGPEVLLFAAPLFMQINKGSKAAVLGYAVTAFFGLSNTFAALGILGIENVQKSVLPGINVVTLLELPGFPVERFGLLLTLPWLIAIYTTMAIYLYLLSYNFVYLFNLKNRKVYIYVFTGLPLLIGYLIPNAIWHETLRYYLTFATVPLVYILPLLTIFLAVIRKKGRLSHEK